MTVIETQDLTKAYGRRRGISDVSLTVSEGEIFGFLGPNGAGKSTTIRLLLGFLRASSGTARILGQDCWKQSGELKSNVGYVAGDVRLYPWLTARRAFSIVSRIRGTDISTRGFELADRFRLEPDLPVRKMSRGNRQKVALVLALAHNPQLVILDEPTSGLDPLMQDTLMNCLGEMAGQGHAIFFSSHTLSEVDSLCDRIAIVKDGRIVANEKLNTLREKAPRTITLRLHDGHSLKGSLPANATELFRNEQSVKFQVSGAEATLAATRWATSQPIADITVGAPNLDSMFRRFYDTELPSAESKS